MSKRIVPALLALCTALALAAPVAAQEAGQGGQITTLDELLEQVNQQHRHAEKPVVDFDAYVGEFSQSHFDYTPYIKAEFFFDPQRPITTGQVEEDLAVLFATLESGHGMYYHFGGDEVFGRAKEQVREACHRLAEKGELTNGAFSDELIRALSFVEDSHFFINGVTMQLPVLSHVYDGTAFLLADNGFVEQKSGCGVERIEGDGRPLDKLLQLSISKEGQLVYYPVVQLERYNDPQPLTVHYADGSTQELSPPKWKSYYEESDRIVDLRYNNGVPVVFVRGMGFDHAPDDYFMAKEFLELAERLKNEPVVIIDLRSNGGGNGMLPMKWLEIFAGEPVPTNMVSINYMSHEELVAYGNNTQNIYYIPYEEMVGIAGWESVAPSYMKSLDQPDKFVANPDRLLVLLTGKNTASSAEQMVDMAHNLENTLIVGSNTGGVLVSNARMIIELPNSKSAVRVGSNITLFPEGDYFQEFVGFEPDLWVAGDAEELVVRLLQNLE